INNVVDIIKGISKKIVLHFSAFYPQFKLMHIPPTPDETVINACDIAKNNGLKYVYPGNTYPSLKDNTYCNNCNEILVKREYYKVINNITSDNKCPKCGHKQDFTS
ncbi:MAG: AmmeMemoRadiSam system radical SAM enzyme, partial [Methanosphaera sp.]|nr:AmmeMemoRadiSam system radical SAM enzyme [Methanosphaera sp.]